MRPGDTIEYTTRSGGRAKVRQAEITGIHHGIDETYLDLVRLPHWRMSTLRLSQITSVRVTTPIGRRA